MRWLVIVRPMVRKLGTVRVEGPATFAPEPIEAPDRGSAEDQLPQSNQYVRYAVVADCSWRQMTQRERTDLMAGAPKPEDPKAHHRNAYAPEVASDQP